MPAIVNDLVIRFANVNGTGSASANSMFSKAIYRMGIPVSPKNIFPSNIQGLPTWYEVRISEKGYLARRDGIDIVVAVNPQSFFKDMENLKAGGYFIYDSTRPLYDMQRREDINYIEIPMMQISQSHFTDSRKQQLFKNIIYIGALTALLDIEIDVVKTLINEQFANKAKLIPPNELALQAGYDYAKSHYRCPIDYRIERRDLTADKIMIEGNEATALGAIYGGATVAAWYPITPSTSIVKGFETYAKKYRVDDTTGKNNYAIVQAEDELAAMGMVIGATWNGARAFTATSGPGLSLMSEFIGLAYFAEIPVSLINVQRGGPSTGMPTRTQQGDITASLYCSHGDTKHILLLPSTPTECFEMMADCLDLADRFQTPVILISDLDLGMNTHLSEPLEWDDSRTYDRGKVYDAEDLDKIKVYGRYLDIDEDGICYRTVPGTHPTKGSFFTRGTSRDEYARYTEDGNVYARVMDRILKKWETAKSYVPKPIITKALKDTTIGMLFFGTTNYAALEAMDYFEENNIMIDAIRIRAVPMDNSVLEFLDAHEIIYVIEQNRDAQFRTVLINEFEISPHKLIPILNYNGTPVTAIRIQDAIINHMERANLPIHQN